MMKLSYADWRYFVYALFRHDLEGQDPRAAPIYAIFVIFIIVFATALTILHFFCINNAFHPKTSEVLYRIFLFIKPAV